MSGLMRRFGKDARGTTAIEYALIAALIAGVLITAVGLVGTSVNGLFQSVVAIFS